MLGAGPLQGGGTQNLPQQNSFLQSKYQFATYYGQKNYSNGPGGVSGSGGANLQNMQMVGGLQTAGSLAPVTQLSSGGGQYHGSQYEYAIDGSQGPGDHFSGSGKQGGQLFAGTAPQATGSQGGKSSGAGATGGGSKNPNQLPKRTPHSELTSYQSEKRLKEYKQQQVVQAHQLIAASKINANSRQQFIIEEEGAYS